MRIAKHRFRVGLIALALSCIAERPSVRGKLLIPLGAAPPAGTAAASPRAWLIGFDISEAGGARFAAGAAGAAVPLDAVAPPPGTPRATPAGTVEVQFRGLDAIAGAAGLAWLGLVARRRAA